MSDKPETLLVRFDAGNKAKLEAYRAANGLRSLNEAVNHMIGAATQAGEPMTIFRRDHYPPSTLFRTVEEARDATASLGAPAAPYKSRLKGEWKAP